MVREARARIADGAIGRVRKIMVDYPQGWLAAAIEDSNTQASWRTDPARAGGGGAIGDIGVHAFRSEEHTSELQSLMRNSYAVFCLKKKNSPINNKHQS